LVYGAGIRRRHRTAYLGNLSLLTAGDAVIWIGYGFPDPANPWVDLGRRGIRRILYQCEPQHKCAARTVTAALQASTRQLIGRGRYAIDELWDFSWHNLEACANAPKPLRVRYVPLGAASVYGLPAALPLPPAHPGALLFFGNVRDGPPRHRCYTELQGLLRQAQLAHTYRAFDDASFQRLLRQHAVWLNLHKGCGDAHNPVTFRVAKALLLGRLVLSERAHAKDEAEYAGLGISFHDNVSGIAAAYDRAVRDYNRAGVPTLAAAEQRIAAFRQRFDPRRIFERANIYADWGLQAWRQATNRTSRKSSVASA